MASTASASIVSPLYRNIFKFGFASYCAFKVIVATREKNLAQKEIEFRKAQLSKPVYELSASDSVDLPWNNENVDQWLYRRVRVTGRPIHVNACLVPRTVTHRPGYEYVVPLVLREDLDETGVYGTQYGVVFSKGFIPEEKKDPAERVRIENVDWQTFDGFVSQLSELSDHGRLQGNSTLPNRISFTHSDMKDFADATGFANKKQASVAMIQQLGEGSNLDERDHRRYAYNCEQNIEFPYPKTLAGALQLAKMPWDYSNEAKLWGAAAFASLLLL